VHSFWFTTKSNSVPAEFGFAGTAVCAVITVLWWSYTSLRPIYLACVAAVAIGLIGANYHFLSDILSAIFVGVSAGYITTKISTSNMES
jgi:hypothetical protein